MKNILIIGAGQLGSRHLQGVLKFNLEILNVFILDLSETALVLAKEKADEVVNNHLVTYTSNWDIIPKTIEIVIVATNADVRERVINSLIGFAEVKFLILEKVLFQCLESYDKVESLLQSKGVKTWVNHPRRLNQFYQKVKDNFIVPNLPHSFFIYGGNWGIGCNGLHFLDFITFLINKSEYTINTDKIENRIIESKRKGFFEFIGTLDGRFDNNKFTIESADGERSPITINIFSEKYRILIHENGSSGNAIIIDVSNKEKIITEKFSIDFQSNLTTNILEDLLKSSNCNLPTLQQASIVHKIFIKEMLNKFNKITGKHLESCPIT